MPDPTLSDALAEVYASAPADAIIYCTLEIWHPAFSEPLYVVNDKRALDARIEAGAERNAGAVVTFVAWGFEVTKPEVSADGTPELTIEMDNVDPAILEKLDLAIIDGDEVTVIYREYLSGAELDGPEMTPPPEVTMTAVTADPFRLRATCSFETLFDRAFPGLVYTLEQFPGLRP